MNFVVYIKSRESSNYNRQFRMSTNARAIWLLENSEISRDCDKCEECKMLQNLPRLPASLRLISLDGCVSLETLSDVLNLNEHQLPYLHLRCVDCLKLAGNYDLALSLLKEYIKNSENEGSSITISTPPKTYKNSKLVGYAMCCVFHVPKYSLPYYTWDLPYPVHALRFRPTGGYGWGTSFGARVSQAMSDHLFLYYLNREDIIKVEFSSPSGLELKSCGLHPIYVHEGDKFNQTFGPGGFVYGEWLMVRKALPNTKKDSDTT
ncbi:hypothetical protein CUMW_233730 [Citrus unshiu]|uniref:Uncharacterized protein n=1 Tax=Citrus unshiu TaxID=55188 RepID=A0A2H5QIL6_CITUN|nr:hypothetical protein CUMW_233730 [Citrus unshiu]